MYEYCYSNLGAKGLLLGAKQRFNEKRFQLAENLQSARQNKRVLAKINALLAFSQMLATTIRCPYWCDPRIFKLGGT